VAALSYLVQRIHRVRPQFQERGIWFLLHDNTIYYTAVSIKQFLAKQEIPELNHPHIVLIYPHQTIFIPQNQIQPEKEKTWTHRGH
jgi:hypothetical protein